MRYQRDAIDDEVLRKMLYLGLLDAEAGGAAWTEPTSVCQGMRLSANATVRVLQRCLELNDKVGHSGRFSLLKLIHI